MNKEKILGIIKSKKTIMVVVVIFIILIVMGCWANREYNFSERRNFTKNNCAVNNGIATININGQILPYTLKAKDGSAPQDEVSADEVIACINKIAKSKTISGVIIRIDSTGGSPEASEEIANAIKGLNKPNVAVIREAGDSGAYLIASATDRIFASEWSDIGSIGVTMSYLDYYDKNVQDGLYFNQLSAGKFKDTGNPDKILTAEEETLLMRDVNIMHEGFIKKVAENRGLDIKKVEALADGSSMLGLQAKENGLIDEIGDINTATTWLKSKI